VGTDASRRYSVLDFEGGDQVGVAADEFPPNEVVSTKYYLNAASRVLSTEAPINEVQRTTTSTPTRMRCRSSCNSTGRQCWSATRRLTSGRSTRC